MLAEIFLGMFWRVLFGKFQPWGAYLVHYWRWLMYLPQHVAFYCLTVP